MDRVTAGARSDHHWQPQPRVGSQALGEFVAALLICSCDSSFQMVCKATFNSSVVLDFAGVYDTFLARCPRCDSAVGSNLESLRATQSSQWTRSRSVSSAWRSNTEKWGCLGWNSIILSFSDIFQPNLVMKCIFCSLTVTCNFIQKFALTAGISTKIADSYFLCLPCTWPTIGN